MKFIVLATTLFAVVSNAHSHAESAEETKPEDSNFCPDGLAHPIENKGNSVIITTCGWGLNKNKPVKDWTENGMLTYGDKIVLDKKKHGGPVMHIYENERIACFPGKKVVGDIPTAEEIAAAGSLAQ